MPEKNPTVVEQVKNLLKKFEDRQEEFGKKIEALEKTSAPEGEFKAEFEKCKQDLSEINKQITAMKERKIGMDEKDAQKFSLAKTFKALTLTSKMTAENAFNKVGAGFEYEAIKTATEALEKAVGSSDVAYVIPDEVASEIIELVRANTVLDKLKPRTITNLVAGEHQFPKMTGGASAYWVAEGDVISDSAKPTFGQIKLNPHSCASLMPINTRTLRNMTPQAEAMIREDFALALGEKIDIAALTGDGSGETPTGLINTPDILSLALGTDGGYFNFEHVDSFEALMDDYNTLRGNLQFVFNPRIKHVLRRKRIPMFSGQVDGPFQIQPPSDERLKEWLQYPFHTTTQLPRNLTKGGSDPELTYVIFGNWNDFLLGYWGGLRLDVSVEAGEAFSRDQTVLRVIQDVDFGIRKPESFIVCSDARTNLDGVNS